MKEHAGQLGAIPAARLTRGEGLCLVLKVAVPVVGAGEDHEHHVIVLPDKLVEVGAQQNVPALSGRMATVVRLIEESAFQK